jgi:hypothetical protein
MAAGPVARPATVTTSRVPDGPFPACSTTLPVFKPAPSAPLYKAIDSYSPHLRAFELSCDLLRTRSASVISQPAYIIVSPPHILIPANVFRLVLHSFHLLPLPSLSLYHSRPPSCSSCSSETTHCPARALHEIVLVGRRLTHGPLRFVKSDSAEFSRMPDERPGEPVLPIVLAVHM